MCEPKCFHYLRKRRKCERNDGGKKVKRNNTDVHKGELYAHSYICAVEFETD